MKYSSFRFSAAIALLTSSSSRVKAQFFPTVDDAYNPNEERGSFDFVMKPYEIPPETTTYVDFFFNLPEDLPDTFHITYGEVINSQPSHLHHFVLQGCAEKIDPSNEGIPIAYDVNAFPECTIPLGQWAPGADIFGNTDLETGILLGRGMGIKAVSLNVHYTDGVWVDEAKTQLKIAEDGIRVHWTPNFRPYTSVSKPLIFLATAPELLRIPAGESRFFVSKTCEVTSSCLDADPSTLRILTMILGLGEDQMAQMGISELACPSFTPFCNIGGELGTLVNRLCPKSCGFCEESADGAAVNPFDPGSYRVTSVNYHAHLLGREMYTTLLRQENNTTDSVAATRKQAFTTPTNTLAMDLESRPFWIYDFQETIPLDVGTRGIEIFPGDKIQVSCVYDSTHRDSDTIFDLSTYDEMCVTTLQVTFATPAELLSGESSSQATSALSLANQFELMSFSCAGGAQNDIYSGVLLAEEDGRDIWKDHPIETAEGCTFPELSFWQGAIWEPRNCDFPMPEIDSEDFVDSSDPDTSSNSLDDEEEDDSRSSSGYYDEEGNGMVIETSSANAGTYGKLLSLGHVVALVVAAISV